MSNFFILRQTKEEWEAEDISYPANYVGIESDIVENIETGSLKAKLFNGVDPWNELDYWNPSGGSGGSSVWGDITGTLSNQTDLQSALNAKQASLISGTTIKTVNSTSLLGSGDVVVQPTLVSGTNIKTLDGSSLLGSGNLSAFPDQSGNSGKYLATNGTSPSWVVGSNQTYIADPSLTFQQALDAFVASGKTVCQLASQTYAVTTTASLTGLTNKIIDGNGAIISMSGNSDIYGLLTTNWSGCTIRNLDFIATSGSGQHFGINWSNVTFCQIENCSFGMTGASQLYHGIYYNGSVRNFITNCRFNNCFATGVYLAGEYCVISNCAIYNGTNWGVYVGGGNNSVTGNTIQYNAIGIEVLNAISSNSDHGTITGNTINHNTKCGLYLDILTFGMVVTGNCIAANGSAGVGVNLGAPPQDSSFGVYIKNGVGVQIIANEFLRNKFNLAIEGIDRSVIAGNTFIADNTLTTNHIAEVGGTNVNTLIRDNVIDVDLFGAAQPIIAPTCSLRDNMVAGALDRYGRVTGDITSVSASPVAITGISLRLIAGRTYKGRLTVYLNNTIAIDGCRFDFDGGTATATNFRAMGWIADTAGVRPLAMTSAIATDITDTTTTGDSVATIDFTITVNAAGTFIPRYGLENVSTGTLTLYRGTCLQMEDVTV